ncbi:hypothetical protein [Pontibacter sp. H249]|uniref:hypothetical protein n=1 Tax=Pontibacter sp. H249 TaxID=3133420 RepID=UPI0030BF4E5D
MENMRKFKSATGKTFLTISYDSTNDLIYNNWIGYASSENVKQGANSYIEVLQETSCSSAITDNSEFVGPWDSSLEWLCNYWVPAAKLSGLRFYAHVVSKGSFAEEAAKKLAECAENSFEVKLFDRLADAQDWIKIKTNVVASA